MILDGHIHIAVGDATREEFAARVAEAGVGGGILISLPPPSFGRPGVPESAEERLDNLLGWCDTGPGFHPFYWLDPLDDHAGEQVAMAVDRGVMGFKVICNRCPPGHARALEVFGAIACTQRPILFHCGVLWDGQPSASFNRPAGFEELLRVPGLRFALAHIGWPWCDELLAVYGKFLNAALQYPERGVEMFVDTTPGTPPIYRREALTKLFTIGYDVAHNVVFGSDCNTAGYNAAWVQEWVARDRKILQELGLGEDVLRNVFAENLERFIGLRSPVARKPPRPGQ